MTPDHRNAAAKAIQIGAGGLPIPEGARCSRCHRPIREDGHNGFCSSDCKEASVEDLSQAQLRLAVFQRDGGKCLQCRNDCQAIRQDIDSSKRMADNGDVRAKQFYKNRIVFWAMAGFTDNEIAGEKSLWEAHHVTEKARGGPNALSNAISLCCPCHRKATGDFSTRRAASRKPRRRFGR